MLSHSGEIPAATYLTTCEHALHSQKNAADIKDWAPFR
jgi:hypothetical protein